MQKPIVVLGAGGHARVVSEACRAAGRSVCGHLAPESAAGAGASDLTLLGDDERLRDREFVRGREFLVGVASQRARPRLAALVRECGGTLASVRHPSAVVSPDVEIGAGTVLLASSVVQPRATIGESVIVHAGATVDHDTALEDGVQVCPGAHLAGNVRCREGAFVGMGALVISGRTVGAWALVGAGAVVISDVPEGVTVVGCPAKVIKNQGC